MPFKLLTKFFSCVHVSAPRPHRPKRIPEQMTVLFTWTTITMQKTSGISNLDGGTCDVFAHDVFYIGHTTEALVMFLIWVVQWRHL